MIFSKDKGKFITLLLSSFVSLLVAPPSLASDIQTVFYISNSDNNSQVHYGIRLNSDCSPLRSNPVYYYWRRPDNTTRPLNAQEEGGYGSSSQSISGNEVNLTFNGFRRYGIGRSLSVRTSRSSNGSCQARALTTIRGASTQLAHARVRVQRKTVLGQTVQVRVLDITLTGSNRSSEAIPCDKNCTIGLPLP